MTELNEICTYPWHASYIGERETKIKKRLQILSSISRIWQKYVLSLPTNPNKLKMNLFVKTMWWLFLGVYTSTIFKTQNLSLSNEKNKKCRAKETQQLLPWTFSNQDYFTPQVWWDQGQETQMSSRANWQK